MREAGRSIITNDHQPRSPLISDVTLRRGETFHIFDISVPCQRCIYTVSTGPSQKKFPMTMNNNAMTAFSPRLPLASPSKQK